MRWNAGLEMEIADRSLTTAPSSLFLRLNIIVSFLSFQIFAGQEGDNHSYCSPNTGKVYIRISILFNESRPSIL
jgi:hypothetical protein